MPKFILPVTLLALLFAIWMFYPSKPPLQATPPPPAAASKPAKPAPPAPAKGYDAMLSSEEMTELLQLSDGKKTPHSTDARMETEFGRPVVTEAYESAKGGLVYSKLTPYKTKAANGADAVEVAFDTFEVSVLDGGAKRIDTMRMKIPTGGGASHNTTTPFGRYRLSVTPYSSLQAGKVGLHVKGLYRDLPAN